MVAPINATASVEVEGETYTFRLNFATIDAARKRGADVFAGVEDGDYPILLAEFARPNHTDFTEDHALALILRYPEQAAQVVETLMSEMGKPAGNAQAGKPKKAT